jgi:hypothetical protein
MCICIACYTACTQYVVSERDSFAFQYVLVNLAARNARMSRVDGTSVGRQVVQVRVSRCLRSALNLSKLGTLGVRRTLGIGGGGWGEDAEHMRDICEWMSLPAYVNGSPVES